MTLPQILSSSSCCWRDCCAKLTSWPESSSIFRSRVSGSRRLLSSSTLRLRVASWAVAVGPRLLMALPFSEDFNAAQARGLTTPLAVPCLRSFLSVHSP